MPFSPFAGGMAGMMPSSSAYDKNSAAAAQQASNNMNASEFKSNPSSHSTNLKQLLTYRLVRDGSNGSTRLFFAIANVRNGSSRHGKLFTIRCFKFISQ